MKEKGLFTGTKDGFVASDDRAVEILSRTQGAKVLMWVHKPRYPEHHRFAFAVLEKISGATGITKENILLWLKFETGRYDWVKLPGGRIVETPNSIAFESMDQEEFATFWNDALEVIKDKVLPGVDNRVYEELRDMIAGKVELRQHLPLHF